MIPENIRKICDGERTDLSPEQLAAYAKICRQYGKNVSHAPMIHSPEQSRGLGDTIAKITRATGIDAAVKAVTHAVGIKDCGCKKRQQEMNRMFPYRMQGPEITTSLTPAALLHATPRPVEVGIVIAGRNNAQWLPEAIESALTQSVPCEVLYADDSSYDNSVEIAQSYAARGLRVLSSSGHAGVCDARNRGSQALTTPYLIVLDSDDVLTPDYAERMLEKMDSDVPFVYGQAEYFGVTSGKPPCPEWQNADIYRANHVNTSAMFARWAWDTAGRWQETRTAWDWDLALRCQKYGTPRKSEAVLHYRRHRDSWSFQHNIISALPEFRRRNSLLSVVIESWSGDSDKIPAWMSAVSQSVRQTSMRAELIYADDRIHAEAMRYRKHYTCLRNVRNGNTKTALREAAGNIVWMPNCSEGPLLQTCIAAVAALTTNLTPQNRIEDKYGIMFRRVKT